MTEVVFGTYNFRTEDREGGQFIFDEVRRKFVALTPEEWVRQHILHYLIHDKKFPKSLIAVERGIELNGLQKRFDVVVFANDGLPKMIIECKAPEELLNDKVFEQIARYNLSLRVDYLWVTNGTNNFCCKLKDGIELLEHVPSVEMLAGK
ncbi:MAG TPA: type I restriction enzyme HsdR N-terminal domain-containing protein [Chitinophagales bacterium]|nr:type I restriction enzyme HsdR N-terminal domain-containing protein [Chitinophagales bacterium]